MGSTTRDRTAQGGRTNSALIGEQSESGVYQTVQSLLPLDNINPRNAKFAVRTKTGRRAIAHILAEVRSCRLGCSFAFPCTAGWALSRRRVARASGRTSAFRRAANQTWTSRQGSASGGVLAPSGRPSSCRRLL